MIPPVYNESLSAGLLSLTPHLHRRSSSGQWLLAPRELHPSEDLSELPPLLDPGITRGCGWTGVSLSDC